MKYLKLNEISYNFRKCWCMAGSSCWSLQYFFAFLFLTCFFLVCFCCPKLKRVGDFGQLCVFISGAFERDLGQFHEVILVFHLIPKASNVTRFELGVLTFVDTWQWQDLGLPHDLPSSSRTSLRPAVSVDLGAAVRVLSSDVFHDQHWLKDCGWVDPDLTKDVKCSEFSGWRLIKGRFKKAAVSG